MNSVAVAMGSGGVRGYALVPIIKRLEKENIAIEAVSGSSIGALMGAYYALHGELDSMMDIAKSMSKKDWIKYVDPNNPKKSIIKGIKVKEFLHTHLFGDTTFNDCIIPLVICATDIVGKKSVYFRKGKIIDAVMASISLPGITLPYTIGSTSYIDGGVLDPVPTKPLLDLGYKKVLGINLTTYGKNRFDSSNPSIFQVLFDSFYMILERQAKRPNSKRLFMVEPMFQSEGIQMVSFHNWQDPWQRGEKEIDEKWPELKKWIEK